MTDSRVVKLAAHYAKEDDSEVFDDLGRFAAYTISDLEDAGLVVFDPDVDDATLERVAHLYEDSVGDPYPNFALAVVDVRDVRAVLAALQAVQT
jgi:hypothetical protein